MKHPLPLLLLMAYSHTVSGQAHVHGEGSVFIAQEGEQWQLNMEIPAADLIGFEHAPEDEQQRARVQAFKVSAEKANGLVIMPASCQQQSLNLDLPFEMHKEHGEEHEHHDHEHDDHGDEHKDHDHKHDDHGDEHKDHDHKHDDHGDEHKDQDHKHDDHGNEHKDHDHKHDDHSDEHDHKGHDHDDHDHHNETHSNVNIEMTYHCDGPVNEITFSLFKDNPSLEKLSVQWFTEAGQAQQSATPDSPVVRL